VLENLTNHKKLGVHTEMFSDGLLALLEAGVVTNELKAVRPGKTVAGARDRRRGEGAADGVRAAGFVMGTRRLYDFLDDNPAVDMRDITWVNDIMVISRVCPSPLSLPCSSRRC
jgi:acyl-CoA hydrolase